MKLTKAERAILDDLPAAAAKAFKSKPTLALLSGLDHKGVISFDPFASTAILTPLGEQVKAEQ